MLDLRACPLAAPTPRWLRGIVLAVFTAVVTTAASTPAQTTLQTKTALGVYAVQGNASAHKVIGPAQSLPVGVMTSVGATLGNNSAAALVSWQQWPGGIVTVDLSEQGGVNVAASEGPARAGTTPTPINGRLVAGPHTLVLRLAGQAGTRGTIEMWATGGLNGPGTITGTYAVDVGDDSSVEFQAEAFGSDSEIVALTFPNSGTVDIAITADVQASQAQVGGFLFKSGLSVRFTPAPHAAIGSIGEGCGPRLSGSVAPSGQDYALDLRLSNAAPLMPGLLVVGTRRVEIGLPGIQCPLLTDVVVSVPFSVDASGTASWKLNFPRNLDLSGRLQAADFSGSAVRASNALHVFALR
jgi:hypothetical protein